MNCLRKRAIATIVPICTLSTIGLCAPALSLTYDDVGSFLRDSINNAYSNAQPQTQPQPLTQPSPQPVIFNDPRADILSYLAFPQSVSAITSRIGMYDYTQGDELVYMGAGYSTLRLWMVGDRVTGYEVTR